MTIEKLTDQTEILPGQWVCGTAVLRDALCARPLKVVKASGQRVYLTNRRGEDEGRFVARKSILYVCSTQAEADAVFAVSDAHYNEIKASHKAITDASMAKIDALIAGK